MSSGNNVEASSREFPLMSSDKNVEASLRKHCKYTQRCCAGARHQQIVMLSRVKATTLNISMYLVYARAEL